MDFRFEILEANPRPVHKVGLADGELFSSLCGLYRGPLTQLLSVTEKLI